MKTLAALLLLTLTGCASFDSMQAAVATHGAKAEDEARVTAEWTLCNAISVGAWRRAYAGNDAKASAWAVLCDQADGVPQ
ncbi:MAG: hypothetical protein MUE59_03635 [Thiobacillaceae bacterium]|jgi:hypothetical protein|nr:hypothetical protein [Thiobacillaceae bacterium]